MKYNTKALYCLFAFLIFVPLSCTRVNTLKELDFPPTSVVSSEERFAFVLDPYISLRDQPGETGITIAHGRRGEVYAVTGKRLLTEGNTQTVWINLENGWVLESSVQLYSSKEKAQTASAILK